MSVHSAAGFLRKATLLLGATLMLSTAAAASITVAQGDSLWSIAQTHGVPVVDLQRLNSLTTDTLKIGQVLKISEEVVSTPAVQNITVAPGDTLWNLAREYNTTVENLRALNNLTADGLRVGQALNVPGVVMETTAPQVVFTAAPAPSAKPAAQSPVVITEVTVKPGDTLYVIAKDHSISVDNLIEWNALDGSALQPGQVLAVTSPRPETVILNSGDSIWSLATDLGVDPESLAEANGITLGTVLDPGTTLRVPSGNQLAIGGPAAPLSVQVRPGDSLWSLASAHGSSVESLMQANGLRNDRLVVGQTLTITPESIAAPAPAAKSPDGLVWPLDGIITSRYGYRQLFGSNFHNGLDINGNVGDPIRSATDGHVTFSGWHGGYGYLVVVTNGNREYYYAHASKVLVEVGDVISQGELIALVGSTGNSTGPHLHFEIRIDGTAVDPLPHLPSSAGH